MEASARSMQGRRAVGELVRGMRPHVEDARGPGGCCNRVRELLVVELRGATAQYRSNWK